MNMTKSFVLFSLSLASAVSLADTVLYVAPNGNDAWSGNLQAPNRSGSDGPKSTLEGARDEIRLRRIKGILRDPRFPSRGDAGAITVYVQPGSYPRTQAFTLDDRDQGAAAGPVVYKGTDRDTVILDGSVAVSGWRKTSDLRIPARIRNSVYELKLQALGITNYGDLVRRGPWLAATPSPMSLFSGGKQCQLARWPNSGWETITASDRAGFKTANLATRRWRVSSSIMAHGFFQNNYTDFTEPTAGFDFVNGYARTTSYLPDGSAYRVGQRVCFVNVPEELDSAGEFYIDRGLGKIFFYPANQAALSDTRVNVLDQNMITTYMANYVKFETMTLTRGRASAIETRNGDHMAFNGLRIADFGNHALTLNSATNNQIVSNDIFNIGQAGIRIGGGDRRTLTPSGTVIQNNLISNFGQEVETANPGIELRGVGIVVRNNSITNGPHTGISISGNDHVVEYNKLDNLCLDTGDAGAIYMQKDFSEQGNIIRYNMISNVWASLPDTYVWSKVMGVYLDACESGTSIYGNVFNRTDIGVFINGGRDNILHDNVFVNAHTPIFISQCGLDRFASQIAPGGSWQMIEKLKAVNYQSAPYSIRYPNLPNILNDDYGSPKRNYVQRNICVGTTQWLFEPKVPMNQIARNYVGWNPGFTDLSSWNLTPLNGSNSASIGYQAPNMGRMGLQPDTFRPISSLQGGSNP